MAATEQLNAIHITACKSNGEAITNYKSAVDAKKGAGLDQDQWQSLLDKQHESAIGLVQKASGTSESLSIRLIQHLPEADRQQAIDVFRQGNQVVDSVTESLSSQLNSLSSHAGDFASGDFSAMDGAYNLIMERVRDGVSSIQKIDK